MSEKAINRRPQFKRSNPVAMDVTADDIDIVRYVADHRFRRSSDIHRHLPQRSKKKLSARLRKLYDLGYLDRPAAQQHDRPNTGKPDIIHALGNQGARLLSELDGVIVPKSNWTDKNRSVGRPHIQHTLRIADLKDAVARLPHHVPNIQIISAADVLRAAPPSTTSHPKPWQWHAHVRLPDGSLRRTVVVPDDVFGLDLIDERKRFYFWVECDRRTMPVLRTSHQQTSVGRKFQAYLAGFQAGLHRTRYNIGNVRFLIITTSQKRIETMLQALAEIAGEAECNMFRFAHFQQLIDATHILAVPWLDGRGQLSPLLD